MIQVGNKQTMAGVSPRISRESRWDLSYSTLSVYLPRGDARRYDYCKEDCSNKQRMKMKVQRGASLATGASTL
jgi:hypothetical protein